MLVTNVEYKRVRACVPVYAIETFIHSVSSHREKPANVTIINDRFLLHDAVASFRARAKRPGTSVDRNRHATRLYIQGVKNNFRTLATPDFFSSDSIKRLRAALVRLNA